MRSSDVVARLGGDEFVVLIPELKDVIQLNMIAANILSVIAKPEEIMGSQCKVTASIGISIFPMDAHNVSSLMKTADLAMYRAKQKGKNNFHINSTNRQQDDRREET